MAVRPDLRRTRVALTSLGGQPRLDLTTGLLAPRVVGASAGRAEVALVATTACLLGGDEVRLEVEVGAGLRLDLRDVAGSVAYHGRGRPCRVDVALLVASGATLAWAGEPLVVSDGADLTRNLEVDVADGGRLLLRDTVVLGRSAEAGGVLRCETAMTYAGRPALVERLHLDEDPGVAVLGPARVVDTVTALGWRPAAPDCATGALDADVFMLAEPGAVARQLLVEAHESRCAAVWSCWETRLSAPTVGFRP
jgi:urease accessory protein